jgi:ammonia channel protein AmtB
MVTDTLAKDKPSATGMAIDSVCGLVANTPASGYVTLASTIIIGMVAGVMCNLVSSWRDGLFYGNPAQLVARSGTDYMKRKKTEKESKW